MEPVTHLPHTVKGVEVLFFTSAEVTKLRGDQKVFATFGALSVLYFKDYNRFFLQINDWRYPLLRRATICSNGKGSYILPGLNGASFDLTINAGSGQALANFNNLLGGIKGLEKSPEDRLVRPILHKKETGTKEVITQTIHQILHRVHNRASTFKTGTKYVNSRKQKINLREIKNRNFKKDAHSKIKKEFFQTSENTSAEFLNRRQNNFNQIEPRDMEALRKTTGYDAAVMNLPQDVIEDLILNSREMSVMAMNPALMATHHEITDKLTGSLKEGLHSMTEGMKRGETRTGASGNVTEKSQVSVEGLTHYEG